MIKKALYPLQFTPLFKYRIWGGEKLKSVLHKDYTEKSVGESWEISNVPGDETQVSQGALKGETLKSLAVTYGADFLGKSVYKQYGTDFPLLIKYIDAKTPLSIQVHPNDELAKERHDSFGKNEMWYIMEAEKDAKIIVGFNQEVSKSEYQNHLASSTITSVLNDICVEKGDTFHIPTGRVHAIGAGVLLAEIQQTSDVTYRIYDYDRVDAKTGKKRELHNDIALDAIDFEVHDRYDTLYKATDNISEELVHTDYFLTNILKLEKKLVKDYGNLDSFVIFMVVDGDCILQYDNVDYPINYGETLLLPASMDIVTLRGNATLLEVHL